MPSLLYSTSLVSFVKLEEWQNIGSRSKSYTHDYLPDETFLPSGYISTSWSCVMGKGWLWGEGDGIKGIRSQFKSGYELGGSRYPLEDQDTSRSLQGSNAKHPAWFSLKICKTVLAYDSLCKKNTKSWISGHFYLWRLQYCQQHPLLLMKW